MMKSKLKKIGISFIVFLTINFFTLLLSGIGIEDVHVGLLFVLGLLFGPYGALGAVLGNTILDVLGGYAPTEILPSEIISFGVSYLAYKLWYSRIKTGKITNPQLTDINNLILFLSNIVICGFIYSAAHGILIGLIGYGNLDEYYFVYYFLTFVNYAFIFGIPAIWLSKRKDFIEIPKPSQRSEHGKLYRILFYLLLTVTLISVVSLIMNVHNTLAACEIALIGILLYAYLTKPFKHEVHPRNKNTIIEKIIRNFLIITLTIAIIGIIISCLSHNILLEMSEFNVYLLLMPTLIITDVIIILFFIPGIIILRFIETNVVKPISSFSEIEGFIQENEKIESDGLVEIYSKYINEHNEIGTLARSYTDLIKHNNSYIQNIREIEGEKERINAELNIATKIQASSLPTEALKNDDFIVDGYSHPAKEVGGDFFDYYELDDDNLAIVIGDASGKGVPAALVAMITQVITRHILKQTRDPSDVLYQLNNQLTENNPESMFLTLWLGIYNRKTRKLTFSNAGHNPPLIKENGKFKYLSIDTGIVLGIMEDFDYVREEIDLTSGLILYTDGITDANNENDEMYGEDRLLSFFEGFKSDGDPIVPLLNDINKFSGNAEQYDDMTLLYLKIK